MIEELRARFRTRFIETARERVRRSLELLGSKDGAGDLVTELHSLAGEAALLGLQDISDAARAGEQCAKRWVGGEAAAQLLCARSVRTVSQCVEAFAASDPSAPVPPSAPSTRASSAPPVHRVLVVDDSPLSGEQIADALGDAGVETRVATDREGAVAAVQSFAPAMVVSDVNMPGVDLGELCAAMRQAASSPIIIVLLSGMSDEELAVRTRQVGADGYVSKQHGTQRIVERLQATLRESAR